MSSLGDNPGGRSASKAPGEVIQSRHVFVQQSAPPIDLSTPENWWRAIEACEPASLLFVIEKRLGDLRQFANSDDVLQEALVRAWQSRASVEWRGHRAFRAWLLTVIDHCILDMRDRERADKRGGGRLRWIGPEGGVLPEALAVSTTPSKVASYRERAVIIRQAMLALPDELRGVVELRILEQRELSEIARMLDLPLSTVQHRLRRGAMLYRDRLRSALAMSSVGEASAISVLNNSAGR